MGKKKTKMTTKGIRLEIFIHSDDTLQRKNTGIDYSVLECDTRMRTFYNIDSVAPWIDEESGKWFCEIISGGGNYIATKTYEEIKELLEANL